MLVHKLDQMFLILQLLSMDLLFMDQILLPINLQVLLFYGIQLELLKHYILSYKNKKSLHYLIHI